VLLLALTLMMIVAGSVAAFAPNYAVFMVGRAFIGIAIGGFWSMSAATAMRLVAAEQVPRALAIVNGGNALATVVAAPLGSFLGAMVGWRGAFILLIPGGGNRLCLEADEFVRDAGSKGEPRCDGVDVAEAAASRRGHAKTSTTSSSSSPSRANAASRARRPSSA
jgi:MFS family permease